MLIETVLYTGIASMYWTGSYRWGGPVAANGERIDFAALTVAHPQAGKTVPFGTCLDVIYRRRTVQVRVIDHGPHLKGRVLDLTPGVAKALRFPGLAKVSYRKALCYAQWPMP